MEELLSLKWNNHKSSFLDVLAKLRVTDQFTDVTLACEGRLFSAHKIVLSTCSEYFYTIFEQISDKNLVIVLKDIKCEDLESLLDYMYLGEVNVKQADLASLIKVAECLKLRGLAVPDSGSKQDETIAPTSKRQAESSLRPRKKKKLAPSFESKEQSEPEPSSPISKIDESSNNNLSDVKKELDDIVIEDFDCDQNQTAQTDEFTYAEDITEPHKVEPNTEDSQPGTSFQLDTSSLWKDDSSDANRKESYPPFSYPEEEFDSSQVLDDQPMNERTPLHYVPTLGSEGWPNKALMYLDSNAIKAHRSNACPICPKILHSIRDCRRHILVHTRQKPFECEFCAFRSNRKDKLKNHIFRVHLQELYSVAK